MKHIRGYIGIFLLFLGIILTIFEVTKPISYFIVGFGLGMIGTDFIE